MGNEILYCARCQVQLRGREFDQGEAFRIDVQAVCKECAPEVVKSLPPDKVQTLLKQMVLAQGKSALKGAPATSPRVPAAERKATPGPHAPRIPSLAPVWVGLGLVFVLILGLAAWVLAGSGRPPTGDPAPPRAETRSPPLPQPPTSSPSATTRVSTPADGTRESKAVPPVPKEQAITRDQTIAGLVGHWKLDEAAGTVAADASGHGNQGTLVNSPAWVPGKHGNALSFNGQNTVVNIECGTSLMHLHKSGLTVCAWILCRGDKRGTILDKSNGNVGWTLEWKSDFRLEFVGDQFQGSEVKVLSAPTFATNVWHHVSATWDGSPSASHAHLYVNGILADGKGVDGKGALREDVAMPLSMGNRRRLDRAFDGLIDDVRVYNRVLSTAEIISLVNGSAK